ncbi:MAG: tandem-95 repeat protein [Verrucomicrobiales bacterium]|nr:tandem-95 repeat protein [Verrucomicrobiales bacterium]
MNHLRCIRCLILLLALALSSLGHAQVSVSIGTLQPGDEVVITYEVTITSPLPVSVTQISHQGGVSGSNFTAVSTDDPETPAATDVTITSLAQDFDFSDAPDPLVATAGKYPTLLANSGARHFIPAGGATLYLGSVAPDAESDGQPDATATGDDNATDDEDGVSLPTNFERNIATTISVTVTGTGGKLNAWIDWNRDGDWDDANEQIVTDQALGAGATILNVTPPNSTVSGTSFARFRLSTDSGLTPTGQASDGEVEDYAVILVANTAPVAVTESYTIAEGGTIAATDATGTTTPGDPTDNGVLANDTDANSDALTALIVTPPAHHNGVFTLNANGTFTYVHDGSETTSDSLTYKPNDGTADGNTVTVSITVTPVNDNPVANTDSLVRQRNASAKITVSQVLANDTDAELNPLTFTGVNSPTANGAIVTLNGIWLIYEPPNGFNAADSFTYNISDGNGGTATGTVNVTVAPDSNGQTKNIISITSSGADRIVRVAGIAGRSYRIETTSDLTPPITWTPHPAGPQTAGANGVVELTDVAPPSPRFYRAVEN